jgi:hypothetical protein
MLHVPLQWTSLRTTKTVPLHSDVFLLVTRVASRHVSQLVPIVKDWIRVSSLPVIPGCVIVLLLSWLVAPHPAQLAVYFPLVQQQNEHDGEIRRPIWLNHTWQPALNFEQCRAINPEDSLPISQTRQTTVLTHLIHIQKVLGSKIRRVTN